MINGGYPETPDAWIERNPYDEPHDPDEYEPNEDEELPVEGNGLEWIRPAPEL